MTFDTNGDVAGGFLIKDEKYLVSNFNPKNYAVIPPKLTFFDENSAKEIMPQFSEYLNLYKQKLADFNEFLSKKISEKTLENLVVPDEKILKISEEIHQIYSYLSEKFKSYSHVALSKLKNSYSGWNKGALQKGFIFKTGEDETLFVLKMKGGEDDNILRLCLSKNNQKKYFLINNGMVVKNFNEKYPSLLPEVLKYYRSDELSNSDIFSVLEKSLNSMQDFKNYVDNPPVKQKSLAALKPIKHKEPKSKAVKVKPVKISVEKPVKEIKLSNTKDYKDLMRECKNKFADAMLNAENNLENFNKTMIEIQKKITDFFSKS